MKKTTLRSVVFNLLLLSSLILSGCATKQIVEEKVFPETVTEEQALGAARVCREIPSEFFPFTEWLCEGKKRVVHNN